jgi:hypothetical protein
VANTGKRRLDANGSGSRIGNRSQPLAMTETFDGKEQVCHRLPWVANDPLLEREEVDLLGSQGGRVLRTRRLVGLGGKLTRLMVPVAAPTGRSRWFPIAASLRIRDWLCGGVRRDGVELPGRFGATLQRERAERAEQT